MTSELVVDINDLEFMNSVGKDTPYSLYHHKSGIRMPLRSMCWFPEQFLRYVEATQSEKIIDSYFRSKNMQREEKHKEIFKQYLIDTIDDIEDGFEVINDGRYYMIPGTHYIYSYDGDGDGYTLDLDELDSDFFERWDYEDPDDIIQDHQIMDLFPEISSHIDQGKEYCYRFNYTDDHINNLHNQFMDVRGWMNTGKCKFNSGDGHLYIWGRKVE